MTETIIDVEDLTKSFNGKVAVNGVSLKVKAGEIFGFLGPNGSGKTTFIRMLCGLLIPDSGRGHCLDYDILTQSYAIKCEVGYMPQRFSLYEDLNVIENLDFIARIYAIPHAAQRIQEMLNSFRLQERKYQLVRTLSGGWHQRLALAAALLHEPKLLLLDEPTAGVDPIARREFWDHLHHLAAEGITTLVSTHYMDEAERCSRLAYIMNGNILTQGTAQEIIEQTQLITWQVTGADLDQLMEKLQDQHKDLQVSAFGNSLHICGKDNASLKKVIADNQSEKWHWQHIRSSVEDIFVYLVSQREQAL